MILLSCFQAINSYLPVLLSENVINVLTLKKNESKVISTIIIWVIICLAGGIIESKLLQFFNQHLEYIAEMENEPLNKKSMLVDYTLIANNNIKNLRNIISSASRRFGLFGDILNKCNKLIRSIVSIVIATYILTARIVIPILFYHGNDKNKVSFFIFTIIIVLIIFSFQINNFFMRRYADYKRRINISEKRRKYYMQLLSDLNYQQDVRIYNQYSLYNQYIDNVIGDEMKVSSKSIAELFYNSALNDLISFLILFLVYGYTCYLSYIGLLQYGGIIVCSKCIIKFAESIHESATNYSKILSDSNYADAYVELKNTPEFTGEQSVGNGTKVHTIDFEHVFFRYNDNLPYVLCDINLSFSSNDKIAIVGMNGSGKSTFIKLLCGFYKPTKGIIRIDGIDIQELDKGKYLELFSSVFQDYSLIEYSIVDNITCGNPCKESKIEHILNILNLSYILNRFPRGIHTNIGQQFHLDGIQLSGGESQKIAIGRAINKNASFLILDEPTATLDPLIEAEIYQNFNSITNDRGAILVSHRLASCLFCNHILVFREGKIIENGNHRNLCSLKGEYFKMWNIQANYFEGSTE